MSNINLMILHEATIGDKVHNAYTSIRDFDLDKSKLPITHGIFHKEKTGIERFKQWSDEAMASPHEYPGRMAALTTATIGIPTIAAGYGAYKLYKHLKNKKNKE